MQPEWANSNSAEPINGPNAGSEIKRSSWNAGMATDLIQPPPGSPAAWQGRRRSRPASTFIPPSPVLEEPSLPSGRESRHPTHRQVSPTRGNSRLTVPSLQTIRSVSGSALGPDTNLPLEDDVKDKSSSNSPPPNPFNFTSTYVTPGKPSGAGATRASQRRGHHYKHSSVSLNFFQEPEQRVPLTIPLSLAVPTLREYYQSITKPQFMKLAWCIFRMCVAVSLYSYGSLLQSVAPLAHLLAYETVVSTSVSCVEVLANFDVWNTSSLRLPFALKRVEVLVAFGLSAVLLFIGGDIVSHIIQSMATNGDNHHSHNHHEHGHNHDDLFASFTNTRKTEHFGLLSLSILTVLPTALRQGLANPLAICTAVIAFVVMLVPLLPMQLASLLDSLLTPVIAFTMIFIGYTSSKLFSGMLAMSYGGPDRSEAIIALVSSDPNVAHVEDVSLWQVHHDLWLASMRITMSGNAADERRVRDQAARAVREAVDVKDVEWETTIEILRSELD